jgi:hypothetical protein
MFTVSLLLTGCGEKKTTISGSEQGADNFESITGSLEDLIKLGKNYRCVMVAKAGDDLISGTNYVASDKVRSDYELAYGDQTWHSHSIVTKEWMYSWIEEMPGQATKIKIADMDKYKSESAEEFQGAENYEADYDYQCYSWKLDQSKFDPPTDINFIDMTELINQMGISDETKSNMDENCVVCDMIADEATRNTCRQSLNCQ